MLDTIRSIRCLQLDPTSAVARSHLLVLWSRIGTFDPEVLDSLAYRERLMFEFWAHQASLVLTEDHPIHEYAMRTDIRSESGWAKRVRGWIAANAVLRDHILHELEERGPLRARDIEDVTEAPWESSGWTNQRNVGRMLDLLSVQGRVLVSRREGGQRLWDLGSRCLPSRLPKGGLTEQEVVRRATKHCLHALGIARPAHIKEHFTRGRYPHLPQVLDKMVSKGEVILAEVCDGKTILKGTWFMNASDLARLEEIEGGSWEPRTTLLSPFDNLICGRDRTEEMFGFRFRLEIYVPKPKRQYGFFVMPILDGDRLIGRIDPTFDRKQRTLIVNAVHLEPRATSSKRLVGSFRRSLEDLAKFLGAVSVEYGNVPPDWAPNLLV
jgi:uncharacterized protein YcaQ